MTRQVVGIESGSWRWFFLRRNTRLSYLVLMTQKKKVKKLYVFYAEARVNANLSSSRNLWRHTWTMDATTSSSPSWVLQPETICNWSQQTSDFSPCEHSLKPRLVIHGQLRVHYKHNGFIFHIEILSMDGRNSCMTRQFTLITSFWKDLQSKLFPSHRQHVLKQHPKHQPNSLFVSNMISVSNSWFENWLYCFPAAHIGGDCQKLLQSSPRSESHLHDSLEKFQLSTK